jgi:dihydrofolate reductase
MRRLIAWDLVTLDGYFEGAASWDLSFMTKAWGAELEAFTIAQSRTAGALLFGRVTYEGMAKFWIPEKGEIAEFMNSVPKVIVSRSLAAADWNNSRVVRDHVEDEVKKLKSEAGKDVFVFGSATLCQWLSERSLIDEYRIGVVPVVLGAGRPFFGPGSKPMAMKLLDERRVGDSVTVLRLEPIRSAP